MPRSGESQTADVDAGFTWNSDQDERQLSLCFVSSDFAVRKLKATDPADVF